MCIKDQKIAALTVLIEKLTARIAELELALAKANKDSSTSSKPPSSDIVKPPRRGRSPGRPRKRKQGGQPGHPRQLREPLPPERVDEQIDYEIPASDVEQLGLIATDQFECIQPIELLESPSLSIATARAVSFGRTTCRKTTSVSCLPRTSSRRTITASSRFVTA